MSRTPRAHVHAPPNAGGAHRAAHRAPRPGRRPGRRLVSRLVGLAVLSVAPVLVVGALTRVDAQTSGSFQLSPGESAAADARVEVGSGVVSADFVLPELGGDNGVYTAVEMRSGGGETYRARARVRPDGTVLTGFSRVSDGTETLLRSEPVDGLRYRAGDVLHLEGSITGDDRVTLKVRAWTGDAPAPAWQETLTDGSAQRIDEAGSVRAWAYLSAGAKEDVRVDYSDLGGAEQQPPPSEPAPAPSPEPSPTPAPEPTPEPTPPPRDTTAPTTRLTSGPADGSSGTATSASFGFAADDPGSRFECRLDAAAWAACTSPWRLDGLDVGRHTAAVRAVDRAGNADATPVSRTFTVTAPSAPVPAPPTTGGKPSADSTGVPTGTRLTRHDGDLVITKPGTVIDKMDIHGFVIVKAPDVVIKRSLVRGGTADGNIGLITNYGSKNLVIEDTDVKPDKKSVWIDGIKGWSFTARRVHVQGGVDAVKIHGDDVTIRDSLLEDTDYFASDPNQRGGATHNDGVQVLKGRNILLTGNTIRDVTNMAVYAAPEQGAATITVTRNWLDGGHCTAKLADKGGHGMSAYVHDNEFGPNRKVKSCVLYVTDPVDLDAGGNVWEAGGALVDILRGRD